MRESEGIWPALVDAETYGACVRLLQDPARSTTRPGRAVHLLSYVVTCAVCGGPVSAGRVNGGTYACLRGCAAAKADLLDEYVQRVVVAWLSRPVVFEVLTAATGEGVRDGRLLHDFRSQ